MTISISLLRLLICGICYPVLVLASALIIIPKQIIANSYIGSSATRHLSDSTIKTSKYEQMPRVKVPQRPFLFINKEEIAAAYQRAEKEEWANKLKINYVKIAATWLERDYSFIKKIIPSKGSLYVYGLGLNLDPREKKKMTWRGWKDPRHVEAADGTIYPNDAYQDKGSGWLKPESKEIFYFVALANGMTIAQLEKVELPALVNAYLLTGNERYAERALWILDAIADIYPYAVEGPLDYPGNKPGRANGGRLDRPYYQAARAMMNYAYFTEALSTSQYAKTASFTNKSYSMLKNIELNLLMNGADYCLRMAKSGEGASFELNNGNIDYNRAPLVVGALLGIPEWVEWGLNGPLGFKYALTNTIDINGRYFETGTSYAHHTRDLLISTAGFLNRMRLPSYPHGYNAFNETRFALFSLDFFTGIQVAGRLPLFGDAGPDHIINTEGKAFDKWTLTAAIDFFNYTTKDDIRKAALKTGGLMLYNIPPAYKYSDADLFMGPVREAFLQKAVEFNPEILSARSSLFFDYGTLILRSGQKGNERAALLRFGPTLNHGQADELGLAFYAKGRDFSFDPGYYNTHLRFGFTSSTVAHNLLVVNRSNQLRQAAPGGDLQTFTDGKILRSAAVNNPQAYADQNIRKYKRRIALIDISDTESYIIDNFWAQGGNHYDYSLHGISKGELEVLPASAVVLQEKFEKGSVMGRDIDYSGNLDPNGKVTTFSDKPFYFSPPGDGFGFLRHPAFYKLNGAAYMKWSATDTTSHQLYTAHFAPAGATLITARSPEPPSPMHLSYALARYEAQPSEIVQFTSVIHPTKGENKLTEVRELKSLNKIKAFALRIKMPKQEHLYIASDSIVAEAKFEEGVAFAGEEGLMVLKDGVIQSASLTGNGHFSKGKFKLSAKPLFTVPLRIIKIENEPLRLLVDAPYEKSKHLEGSILRLNKPGLIRPFAVTVLKAEAGGLQSWITLEASGNTHAVGKVRKFNKDTKTISTDAPFPHTRPYIFNYDRETGLARGGRFITHYNGGYNGFWLLNSKQPEQRALIRTFQNKRTEIVLNDAEKSNFKVGDSFEIQLFATGDTLEVPAWAEATKDSNGKWNT